MSRTSAVAFLSFCLLFPAFTGPAAADPKGGTGDSMEAVEKDLVTILKEMETIQAELDRLGEIAAFPKATGIRIEIHREGPVPAPVRARILVQGKVEEERDFAKTERDNFSGAVPAPIVFQIPYLPGIYHCRFEVLHPSWKASPATEFDATIRKGDLFQIRVRLTSSGDKAGPSLSPVKDR